MDFYTHTLKDLDFWFFELLMLSYIGNKMFNLKLYSHQKLAIYFNSTLCLTKMIVIILSCIDAKNPNLWYTSDEYEAKIIFGIIIYFALISIRSYINSKIKVYMDLKYISTKKLLILYGLFGAIIYTIICLIATFVECTNSSIFFNEKKNENFVCKVQFNNTDSQILKAHTNISYLDNFDIYFETFKYSNYLEIIKEIIIILLAGITYFYYKYCSLMIIKFLSPIHYMFSNQIYFFIKKLVLPVYTLIKERSFFANNSIGFITPKYILDISGDFLSLIGFLVFLELIELNFCNYNIDLRRNIMDRSINESISLLDYNYDDDDDEEENNIEN